MFDLKGCLHDPESGCFFLAKKDLKEAVPAGDRLLELAELPDGYDFDRAFVVLFAWRQAAFARVEINENRFMWRAL